MEKKHLLIFPRAAILQKDNRRPSFQSLHLPTKQKQAQRLDPIFQRLEQAFEQQRVSLQESAVGLIPEQALVFETVSTVDNFINAVKRIEGFDWLVEWEREIAPDEDFFSVKNGERQEKTISGRLFLIMSDQQAMRELISLWNMYKQGDQFPRGKGKWKDLFQHLKDVRRWNISDRFYGTGFLEEWNERVSAGQETIKFEIELWFRSQEDKRNNASKNIRQLIEEAQGKVISESIISDIAYHGMLAEAPIEVFRDLSESTNIKFIRSEYIMFFRPVGQAMVVIPEDVDSIKNESLPERPAPINTDPVVALLDGMPLENHNLLKNRLIIDDPDNFSSQYRPHERVHGTAMASLIIHGELDEQNTPLTRPIYVRPILMPDYHDWRERRVECIPTDALPVDLVHRAVKRIFEGEGDEPPVAPTVRVINLSIGDEARPFDFTLSPWARLLDWLSYKYNVLFIVSSGNFRESITLDLTREQLRSLSDQELSEQVLKYIYSNAQHRRILTPSESINALTIGALHSDSSQPSYLGNRKDIMNIEPMLSPISRIGLGYRRSVKPDIVFNGGRQLFEEDYSGNSHFKVNSSILPPGQKVAFPREQGELSGTAYLRGTSNSAALATRLGSQIYDMLNELKQIQAGGELIDDKLMPVLIKTLLVHGASWGSMFSTLERVLCSERSRLKDRVIPRLIGYGVVDPGRVLECTTQRVTLIGGSRITKDQAHEYTMPLPPSLVSKKIWRRLTITLAWFTPVNSNSQKYRKAHLWFNPPREILDVNRVEVDWQTVQRGTVQHEILEGDNASPFVDGDVIKVKVNCREDAGGLKTEAPYGLAVSLEVAEGIDLPIYDEVRDRIRPMIPIQPGIQEI